MPFFVLPTDLVIQHVVRLPLPIVEGNKDYREHEELLRRMDELLDLSGVEQDFLASQVSEARRTSDDPTKPLTERLRACIQRHARQTLRCTVARILSSESHRVFSRHLAESALLQWFCGIRFDGVIRVPSKSSLQRMEASVPTELIQELQSRLLLRSTQVDEHGQSALKLADPIDLSMIWMDATCAKLDIHYPCDWLLLRDATRTIMKAIITIRAHGLRHRMQAPERFIAMMNAQCMAMSGSSRRGRGSDKKRNRKRVLRTMKRIVKKVKEHGQRYRDLLEQSWSTTDLTQRQAECIIQRIDSVLEQLPDAIKQAHERIIGERPVPNDKKVLNIYQPHAKVYVRGKAGADAEFGLQLLVCESAEGLIVDSHIVDGIINDSALLMPAIERMRDSYGDKVAKVVVTDRGFSSLKNDAALDQAGIINATLPRNPADLQALLEDPAMRQLQQRRAQTEARIGIFKGKFLGDQLPTKNLEAQIRFVAWATLAHNLWVLARRKAVAQPLAVAG